MNTGFLCEVNIFVMVESVVSDDIIVKITTFQSADGFVKSHDQHKVLWLENQHEVQLRVCSTVN